jgi:hypothetical protein
MIKTTSKPRLTAFPFVVKVPDAKCAAKPACNKTGLIWLYALGLSWQVQPSALCKPHQKQ